MGEGAVAGFVIELAVDKRGDPVTQMAHDATVTGETVDSLGARCSRAARRAAR